MRLKIVWREGWAHVHGTGPDGKRIRRALGTQDNRRAEEARAALEARLWKQSIYGPEATVTFDEAALAYAKDGGDVRFLEPVAAHFLGRKLSTITPSDIRAAAKSIYPEAKAATLNRQAITPARAVINWAHDQGWCAPIRVASFDAEKPKRKAVDGKYLEKLRPHLPERLYALMLFMQHTGRRIGDALSLTPADIDLYAMTATIRKTKNGKPAVAHLTPEVADLIRQWMDEPTVFGYSARSSVYPTLRRAAKKAGVEYLGTHQPGRHSFATALMKKRWTPKEIADAGGWETTRLVSEVYTHPHEAGQRAAQIMSNDAKSSRAKSDRKKK